MAYKMERREFVKVFFAVAVGSCIGGGIYLSERKNSNKQLITREQLSEYDLVTYFSNGTFDVALIDFNYGSCSLDVNILRTYDDSINLYPFATIKADTQEEAIEQFYSEYNVVKTDSAIRAFRSYLGDKDYYTISEINQVFDEERKSLDQSPQKQLIR